MGYKRGESLRRYVERAAKRGGSSAVMAPDEAALRRLWGACATDLERVVLVAAAGWGLRSDELRHLCVEWWDASGAIRIPTFCACPRCHPTDREREWSPKTAAGVRDVDVSASPMSMETFSRFFAASDRVRLSQQQLNRLVRRLYRRAGLPEPDGGPLGINGQPVHALRAAAAKRLGKIVNNPEILCGLLGWGDLQLAKTYIVPDAKKPPGDLWEPAGSSASR